MSGSIVLISGQELDISSIEIDEGMRPESETVNP
jgi:hypothetical protein